MVITGDLDQSDRSTENGLKDILSKLRNKSENNLIKVIEMNNSDIERSEIVRKIIEIYKCDVPTRPSWASSTPDEYLSKNKFDFDALYRR